MSALTEDHIILCERGDVVSETNPIDALRAVGIHVDGVTERQRAVLASLSPEEVSVLSAVKNRLTAEGHEVEGHATDSGGLFW